MRAITGLIIAVLTCGLIAAESRANSRELLRAIALSGDHVGNGGKTISCDWPVLARSDGNHYSHLLLDFYEGENSWGRQVPQGEGDPYELVYSILLNLAEFDQNRASKYIDWLNSFFEESRMVTGGLIDTDDAYVRTPFPQDVCKLTQAAVQVKPQGDNTIRYWISSEIWEELPDVDRAGLILHEIVYREGITEHNHTLSDRTRYLVAAFADPRFVELDQEGYQRLIEESRFEYKYEVPPPYN